MVHDETAHPPDLIAYDVHAFMVVARPGDTSEGDMLTTTPTHLPDPGTTDATCPYRDPAVIDVDDDTVAPVALRHMADAATHARGVLNRTSCYPPEVAVDALRRTVAAATEIAGHLGGYVGDIWPPAGREVDEARELLIGARDLLDSACHRTTVQLPATDDPVTPAPTTAPVTAPNPDLATTG